MRLIDADKIDYIMEEKPSSLDYVRRAHIADEPTVEAIPYEFLRKLAKNQPNYILTVWDFLPRVIENIIEVWEKENDKETEEVHQ